jgi:predicted O-methyltransferase YrrM
MEPRIRDLLRELERTGAANDAVESDRARKMLNLESETAGLLAILARASAATRVLEIGTSNGYSTIWLAWAVAPSGGRVTSIERNAKKQEMARDNLSRAGFEDRVELCLGEATAMVRELTGPFDLVFFDADRISAPEQLRFLLPKLAPQVLLIADNVLSHAQEVAGYLDALSELPGFEHVVVPVGKGLSIASRTANQVSAFQPNQMPAYQA